MSSLTIGGDVAAVWTESARIPHVDGLDLGDKERHLVSTPLRCNGTDYAVPLCVMGLRSATVMSTTQRHVPASR